MINDNELIYQLALSRIKGICFNNWKTIIEIDNSTKKVNKLNKK